MKANYTYEPYRNEIMCNYKKTKGCQTYPYHRHNGYEIYYFIQGNIYLYIEDQRYLPQMGDLAIIPPNCFHRIVSLDEQTYERITINIKETVVNRLSTTDTDLSACFHSFLPHNPPPVHLPVKSREQFTELAHSLENMLNSKEYGSDIMTNVYLSQLLLLTNYCFQQNYSLKNNIMPSLIKDIMKYIRGNLQNDFTINDLSQAFYSNPTYISRMFKKHTGLTLREYILDCRIEHAKKMLHLGHSVSEACYGSGFHDYANFIRSFKNVVGIPPGKYKKQWTL